jgi:hypothetical protein
VKDDIELQKRNMRSHFLYGKSKIDLSSGVDDGIWYQSDREQPLENGE